jgi:hypothetical protein
VRNEIEEIDMLYWKLLFRKTRYLSSIFTPCLLLVFTFNVTPVFAAGADHLHKLNCAEGQVPKYVGGEWVCATSGGDNRFNVRADLTTPVGAGFVVARIPFVEIERLCLDGDGCELRFQEHVVDLTGSFPQLVLRSPTMLSGPLWYSPIGYQGTAARAWMWVGQGWTGTQARSGLLTSGRDGDTFRFTLAGGRCFSLADDDTTGIDDSKGFALLNLCGTLFPAPDFIGEGSATLID